MDYSKLSQSAQRAAISETPEKVVDLMVSMSDITPLHRILEPSAGRGAIIRGVKRFLTKEKYRNRSNIYYCELNQKNRDYLYKNIDAICLESDCMALGKYAEFDRIIMNPPLKHTFNHIKKCLTYLHPLGRLIALIHSVCLNEELLNFLKEFEFDTTQVDPNLFGGQTGIDALILRVWNKHV